MQGREWVGQGYLGGLESLLSLSLFLPFAPLFFLFPPLLAPPLSDRQNGLADVIQRVGTSKFARLRVGVGPVRGDRKRFVLGNFDGAEVDLLPGVLARAAEVLRVYAHRGFQAAANCANRGV